MDLTKSRQSGQVKSGLFLKGRAIRMDSGRQLFPPQCYSGPLKFHSITPPHSYQRSGCGVLLRERAHGTIIYFLRHWGRQQGTDILAWKTTVPCHAVTNVY